MALLLTGAGGHVGGGVARVAAQRGLDVVATYRGSEPPALAEELGERIKWVACELSDKSALEKILRDHSIDCCLHCAAIPNEAFARPDPRGAFDANLTSVANLLELGRQNMTVPNPLSNPANPSQNRGHANSSQTLCDQRPEAGRQSNPSPPADLP